MRGISIPVSNALESAEDPKLTTWSNVSIPESLGSVASEIRRSDNFSPMRVPPFGFANAFRPSAASLAAALHKK